MAGTTRISVCILYFIGQLGFSVPECLILGEKEGYFVSLDKQFCYKTYTAKLVWDEAKDFCRLKGGHLAKLTGQNQAWEIYKGLFSGFSFECLWIGMSDPKNDGEWKWLDGSPVTSDNWDYDIGDFVWSLLTNCGLLCDGRSRIMIFDRPHWQLRVGACSNKGAFICQFDFVANNKEVSTTLTTPVVSQESTSSFTTELTTLPTEETTTPVVQNRNLRPKKVLQHSSTKRPIVRKLPFRGTIRGEPVLRDNVYSVSMCARLCLRSTTDCTQFNYNLLTHQCLVFGGNEPYHAEEGSDWEIWTVS